MKVDQLPNTAAGGTVACAIIGCQETFRDTVQMVQHCRQAHAIHADDYLIHKKSFSSLKEYEVLHNIRKT